MEKPPDYDEARALLQLGGTLTLADAALGVALKYFPEADAKMLRSLLLEMLRIIRAHTDLRMAEIKAVIDSERTE